MIIFRAGLRLEYGRVMVGVVLVIVWVACCSCYYWGLFLGLAVMC